MDSKPLTLEEIIKAYNKAFPTRYEPMTLERMIQFVRIIEQAHGIKDAV